ncbi:MAG: hypothetical protein ACRDP1_01555 [Nocardioidaceae bacterium]
MTSRRVGHDVVASGRLHHDGLWRQVVVVRSEDAVFTVAARSRVMVRRIVASLRILPRGWVTVPLLTFTQGRNHAGRITRTPVRVQLHRQVRRVGLSSRVRVHPLGLGRDEYTAGSATTLPKEGTIVRVGTTVRVQV